MEGTYPIYRVQARSSVPASNCTAPHGVPSIPTSPFPAGDTHAQPPHGDISNAEFYQSTYMLVQLVASLSHWSGHVGSVVSSSVVTRIG